ncbi:MAG: hypothetical protein EXR72_14810 [Myxococcales bacterium]|nr:hypothetical protein [Myxococcales bacterium]
MTLLAACSLVGSGCGATLRTARDEGRKEPMDACTRTIGPEEAEGLQELLDGLPESGAVVCLKPGRYPGRILLRRSLTLRGLGAASEVILDGEGHGPVVKVDESGIKVVIERLTISGGKTKGGGGAIAWNKASELTLRDAVLRDNHAPRFGGGAIEASLGAITVERCRIEDNHAPVGAALLLHEWAKLTLRDSAVIGNQGPKSGALAIRDGAEVNIARSTIVDRDGVAIQIDGDHERAPTVTIGDSILSSPTSVLLNDEGAPGKVTISHSVIHGATGLIAGAGDDTPAPGEAFVDGGGNRTGDPLLGDDLRPRRGSPALGLAGPAPAGATDLDGRPRAATAGALEAAYAQH